jgi:hypothetical protein
MPTGRLCLRGSSLYQRTTSEKQWQEASAGNLPRSIPKIVKYLEGEAPKIAVLVGEADRKADTERREWESAASIPTNHFCRSLQHPCVGLDATVPITRATEEASGDPGGACWRERRPSRRRA